MTVSICYRCGSCGKHDLYHLSAWSNKTKYRLCDKCREDLERLKFKPVKVEG